MADNNKPAGFGRLMRYADNLADYTRAKEDGLIDDDVFVIVLEEQVAIFKGKTFDWSAKSGVSQEDFDTLYDGVIEAEEVTAAALNDLNDRLSELAENAQGETVTKEEFETAVNNLNESLSEKADAHTTSEAITDLSGQVETLSGQIETLSGLVETAVTSKQLSSAIDNVNNTILENEEITAAALVDLNTKITDILERLNNAGL